MLRWLSRLTLLLAVLALPLPGHANESLRPAAVVNDEVISVLDLEMRIRLAMLTSGLRDTPRQRERIGPQVLQNLIDERLQMQEAESLGISVSEEEVDDRIERIASGNNMSARQLLRQLESSGVLPQAFREQIRTNIAWQKIVGQQIRPEVQVSQEEIEDAIQRLRSQEGEQQMRAREIFLSIDSAEEEPRARENAQRLVQQLRQGANFEALAREFSQSATASVGGDLGWVTGQGLPESVAERLENASRGEVLGPIRAFNGLYIVQLMDRRRVSAGEEEVQLRQLVIDVPQDASDSDLQSTAQRLSELAGDLDSCEEMTQVGERLSGVSSTDLGTVSTANLPDELRVAISDLSVGTASQPMRLADGLSVLMVCEREFSGVDRGQISRNLTRERLNLRIQRRMRDLRRDAHVDIRI